MSVCLLADGFVISLMDRLDLTFFNSGVGRDPHSRAADPVMLQLGKASRWASRRRQIKQAGCFFFSGQVILDRGGTEVVFQFEAGPRRQISFSVQGLELLC